MCGTHAPRVRVQERTCVCVCVPLFVCFRLLARNRARPPRRPQVITHLIRKAHVLAVAFTPEPQPGESDTAYAVRATRERTLTLHEGFNPDP